MKQKINKLFFVLILITSLFCIVSCKSDEESTIYNIELGNEVSSLSITKADGTLVTITKDTNGIELYNILLDVCDTNNDYFKFEHEANLQDGAWSGKLNGIYCSFKDANAMETQNTSYMFASDKINGSIYSGVIAYNTHKFLSSEIYKKDGNIMYGGVSLDNRGNYLGFKNGDDFVPFYPPAFNDARPDELDACDFNIKFTRVYKDLILTDAVWRAGFYDEVYISDYTYKINLTENYIIFKVEQPYGFPFYNGRPPIPNPECYFNKTVYYNIHTHQIDKIITDAKIVTHRSYYYMEYEYNSVLTRIGKSEFDKTINKFHAFVEKYGEKPI